MDKQNKPVKIVNSVPALVADGHGLGVDPASGNASLVFIQVANNQKEETQELEGSIVANIRMSREQLKKLSDDVTQAISNFEKNEKQKASDKK